MVVWLAAFALAGCGGDRGPAVPPETVESDWPAGELHAGGAVEAELDRGEIQVYRLPLEAGQFLRVQVEQDGVDVVLRLEGPDGELLLSADRRIAEYGPELVMAVAERSGDYHLVFEAFPSHGPGRYRACIEALRPATARDRRAADTYRRFREAEDYARESRERATAVWADALATWRELGEPALEGEVLDRIALDHHDHDEWEAAAARWQEALTLFERVGARRWELFVRDDLATALIWLARYDDAIHQYRAAAALAHEAGDRRQEASALYGLGKAFRQQGELQQALTYYEAALEHLAPDDPDRATTLHNLGVLYRLHFQDPRRARELLLAACDLYRPEEVPTDGAWKARALHQLALLAQDEGRLDEARGYLKEALGLWGTFDRCGQATALASLAVVEDEDGDPRAADARLAEAFRTVAGESCAASEVALELIAGELAEHRREPAEALAAYRRGSDEAAAIGDRRRLADGLAGVARAERALGHLEKALAAGERVLAIVEEIRPTVLREDLRTAFFATAQDRYDLQIALLSELGEGAEAWSVAERARAQALRDLLAEAGAGVRRNADPALIERERDLRHRINRLEGRRLKAAETDEDLSRELRRQIDDLVAEVERVRGEIRRESPAYEALTAPEPLALADAQRALLEPSDSGEPGTLLLEYRLGEEESWLWAIGSGSFAAFRLPPRAEIERVAEQAAHWARSLQWPGHPPPPLCRLSRSVLGPAARLLGDQRLVVVPDGALETVPFAVLPDPAALGSSPDACAAAPPLAARHEIVYLPSVAALVAQRRLHAGRRPAPGWLAMVADPVYRTDDPRLPRSPVLRPASSPPPSGRRFERLRHSGEEAEAVLAGLPRDRTFAATGLRASKGTATGGSLAGYRVVHFATHGVLDADHPLLSFLALSERAADGSPVDGALRASEIYDLELPAELVVLSACDTALGRETRGEGLVSGLPRAFLYAGAERVLVSLWPVQDRSTRDLMALFYRGLFDQALPPGRALQEAQRSLWSAGRPPYQWAGFVLQGDWRPLPPFDP